MVGTWPVFKLVQNVGISISVYIMIRYILIGIASTGMVSTTLLETSERERERERERVKLEVAKRTEFLV